MPNKVLKKKLVLKKSVTIFITKLSIIIIIFLLGMILVKQTPKYKVTIQEKIYENSLKFTKARDLFNKYFGSIFSIDSIIYEEKPVFNENITYTEKHTYKDGVALTVSTNYMVPSLETGIVVYIGDKENYGQTIIIEQVNGIDVFYGNVSTTNLKLYDYVEKGDYIGETTTDKLYLVFQKNGVVLDYKEYI